MRQDVLFDSDGSRCAGWLYLPAGEGPFPAVAMAHGMGAVKEMYIEPFAQAFAQNGIAALLFDYRGFGASEGEPRSRISPRDQIEDYRSALTCLALRDEVDANRLGVWGTSFSGGHVLHLGAYDPRVKAVVSQVGAMDLYENARRVSSPEQFEVFRAMIAHERTRKAVEGTELYIPNAAPTGSGPAMQVDDETHDWLINAQRTVAPAWRNEVTVGSFEAILEHAPAKSIERISPRPLLMILATEDKWTPPDMIRAAFDRAGEPKRLLEIPGSHYAVYEGAGQTEAAEAAVDWFRTHLCHNNYPVNSNRRAKKGLGR
jgi:hypothetical protein